MAKNKNKNKNDLAKAEKIFEYFDNEALYQNDINNKERFKMLSEEAAKAGDEELTNMFSYLEEQQGKVEKLFDIMDNEAFYTAENNEERMEYIFSEYDKKAVEHNEDNKKAVEHNEDNKEHSEEL